MEIVDLLEYSERAQLRDWFEQHAASQKCCWIAMYRGKKKPEDSTLKRLGDGRLAQRLSPRQKKSHWTELNIQRCADLEARGLMTDLGRAALQKAQHV